MKNVKSMLTHDEYIGYLKGTIINLVAEGEIIKSEPWLNELRAALKDSPADNPATVPDRLSDATMREIRDGMVRLDKK